MLIHSDVLQDFIERIMCDINHNINIIDTNGIIVASGYKNRIGKLHKIALKAAQQSSRIDIEETDTNLYSGVMAGVNQPFYYNNMMVGVIGITGVPNEINEMVKIVKSMVELLYEQEILKHKIYNRQNKKVFFVNELLNLCTEEGKAIIMNWGSALGYDMSARRTSIIIDFIDDEKKQNQFTMEKILGEFILKIKKIEIHQKNDIMCVVSNNRIIILKTSSGKDCVQEKERLIEYGNEIFNVISEDQRLKCFIAIGSFYDNLQDMKESYFEAGYVMNQIINDKSKRTGYIEEYLLGYLLSKVPAKLMDHYFKNNYEMVAKVPELSETITSLTKCNMHLSRCSQDLFLHRNTVQFRFNKIREILQIDPLKNKMDYQYLALLSEYISKK